MPAGRFGSAKAQGMAFLSRFICNMGNLTNLPRDFSARPTASRYRIGKSWAATTGYRSHLNSRKGNASYTIIGSLDGFELLVPYETQLLDMTNSNCPRTLRIGGGGRYFSWEPCRLGGYIFFEAYWEV